MKARSAVGFIGAGRVGTALARELARLGYDFIGLADRSAARVRDGCRRSGLPYRNPGAGRIAAASEVLFLTVPDREITGVFGRIRSRLRPGTVVAHCSGFFGAELFTAAAESGIETLAFHPAMAFSEPQSPGAGRMKRPDVRLPALVYALDGSRTGIRFGRRLARQLEGTAIVVRGPDRPLYHAMCVFASNLQHALREAAERVGCRLGIAPAQLCRLLNPLMRATFDNLVADGTGPGLTGPVRRGDSGTIAGHLTALSDHEPELVPLYIGLTRRLVKLARRQGTSRLDLQKIRRLFDAYEN